MESLRLESLVRMLTIVLGLLAAEMSFAANIYHCSNKNNSCVIKLEEGVAGDRVKVLDITAHHIADGIIKKRRGSYAIISISSSRKTILKGYPVLVEIDSKGSGNQWAASFSFQD